MLCDNGAHFPGKIPGEYIHRKGVGLKAVKHFGFGALIGGRYLLQGLLQRNIGLVKEDARHAQVGVVGIRQRAEIFLNAANAHALHLLQLMIDNGGRRNVAQRRDLLIAAGHKDFADHRNIALPAKQQHVAEPAVNRVGHLDLCNITVQHKAEVLARELIQHVVDLPGGNLPRFPPEGASRALLLPATAQALQEGGQAMAQRHALGQLVIAELVAHPGLLVKGIH